MDNENHDACAEIKSKGIFSFHLIMTLILDYIYTEIVKKSVIFIRTMLTSNNHIDKLCTFVA